jgi:selenocysteine-specific elongation factor
MILRNLQDDVKTFLDDQFHKSSQQTEISDVKKYFKSQNSEELIKYILDELVAAQEIKLEDNLVIPANSASEFSDKRKTIELMLEDFLLSSGFTPPKRMDIPQILNIDKQETEVSIKNLISNKKATKISREYIMSAEKISKIISALKDIADNNGIIEINTFKETFSITRKYAIPLLEYLDTNGYTRRLPDGKRLLL